MNNWFSGGGGNNAGSAPVADKREPAKEPKTVYYLGVLRVQQIGEETRAEELVADRNLSMYGRFTVGSFNDGLTFTTKTIAARTQVGERQRVQEMNAAVYAYRPSYDWCVILVSQADPEDEDFYDIPAQTILSKTADGFKTRFGPPKNVRTDPANTFTWPDIAKIRTEAETIHMTGHYAVRRELDETKKILHKTIEQVMQRGEKLDDLVAKSDDLGLASKSFYKTAQKQNSCCVVM